MRLCSTLLVATALCGCAESHTASSLLYMEPYKLDDLDCTELRKRAAGAATRTQSVERLRDRANESAAGPVINSLVYGPDYSKARWEQQVYDEAIARKNCSEPPPPPPPPAPKGKR